MAETSNIVRKYVDNSPFGSMHLPVGSSTILAVNDLIARSSGSAIADLGAIANFVGVSNGMSTLGDVFKIQVYLRSICTITVASAGYAIGADLKRLAGANGTAWTLQAATSGTDAFAWSMEYTASATSLDVLFDSYMTGNALANEGLFNTSTNAA